MPVQVQTIDNGKRKRNYDHIGDPAERRRVRNRESAKLARMNKKQYLATLENNLKQVEDKHEELINENKTLRDQFSRLIKLSLMSTEEIEQVLGCDYTQLLENPTIPEVKKDHQPQKKKSTVQFHQQNGATTAVSTFSNDAQGYVQVNQSQMPLPAPVPLAPGHYPITSPAASSGYKSEDASPLALSSGLVPNQFVFPEPGNNFTISNMVKEECYQNLIDQAWND